MNYQAYLAHVQERLQALGFAPATLSTDLTATLSLAMERQESWGRLTIALPAAPAAADPAPREALARETVAWLRHQVRRTEERRYAILVFPFEKSVGEETAEAVKALRQEDAEGRWGLVAWSLDLAVELIDRPGGFPRVEDKVARALTEVPRGAVEGFLRDATGPKIGHRTFGFNLGYVPATRFILATTIAYYIWVLLISKEVMGLVSGPGIRTLIAWGANQGQLVILGGEHWRLLSHILLHGGLMHLLFNMWALWSLGRHTELIYGSGRMIYIYLFAGLSGGIASTVFRPEYATSVGASGAVLGLMGALVYFAVGMRGRVDWRAFLGPVAINLFYGFMIRGIDNYAHIGGFIGGFLAAFLVGIAGQRKPWRLAAMIAGGAVALVVLSGLVPLPHLRLF
ncbi:MAG TPA: rhomboid family intramembrane serine protease [Symbiobacteriaceae bacterium]|nr:rhomboid family intramembrane serine protease [Symbiobacteriaceae bacterium]